MQKPRWSEIQRKLAGLPAEDLRAVVRALFYRSADNRRFLVNSLLGGATAQLDDDRRRIAEAFPSGDAPRRPRLSEAKRIVRDYRLASPDLGGAADLMLTLLEAGTRFGRDHGDPGDAYFGVLAGVLGDLASLLRDAPEQYAPLRKRLERLREQARGLGSSWGAEVERVLAALERASPP